MSPTVASERPHACQRVPRARHRLGIALLVGATLLGSAPALAEEFQCRLGGVERRVELHLADSANRVPCEVLYWRNVAQQTEPRVLWHAESDARFCIEKTQELIARLEDGGWRCTVADATRSARGEAEPQPESDDRQTAASPPERSTPPDQDQSNGRDATERQQAVLGQAIARDLERLNQLTASATGRFSMHLAEFGDLDRDGVDDAAVIMTYRTGSDVAYYLLAYLFDGSAFVPAAKTYLGGSAQSIEGSQIASIDDGAIRVRFDVAPSGDGVATGHETAAFVFQDGELTEAPTS